MDPLSDVLRSFRLSGGVFLDARFTAPWCVVTRLSAEDCGQYMTDLSLLIAYHFVVEGRLLVTVEGEPTIEVRAGEVILLPRNDLHVLGSDYGLDRVSAHDLIQPSNDGGLARISHGGGGETTHIVCGFLGSQDVYNPVIAALPRILKLDLREGASRDFVDASVRFAASELTLGRFASSSLMSRLSELLFVEAVRALCHDIRQFGGRVVEGSGRPSRRARLSADARKPERALVGRSARPGSLDVAQRIRATVHHTDGHAADPVSDTVATPDCKIAAARGPEDHRPVGIFGGL